MSSHDNSSHGNDFFHNDSIPCLNAVFIRLNINEIFADNTLLHDDLSVYMDSHIGENALHTVKSVYLCLHYTHTSHDTLSNANEKVDFSTQCHVIGSLLERVLAWLSHMTPAAVEVSWECVEQEEQSWMVKALYTLLSHPSQYRSRDNRSYPAEAWTWSTERDSPVTHRIVMNWEVYQALCIVREKEWDTTSHIVSHAVSHTEALHIDVQLVYRIQRENNSVLDFIAQWDSLRADFLPSHISIEWDVARDQKKEHYSFVKEELVKKGFFPYQYWHFAKKGMPSNYLRAIYAMHPYLGICIGNVNETAISWLIGKSEETQGYRGYMGTMSSHSDEGMTHIAWELFSIEDELEMRMMQAAQTEILLIPAHMREYYHHTHEKGAPPLEILLSNQHFLRYEGIPHTLPSFLTDESKLYIESQYRERKNMEVWVHSLPNI